MSPHAPTERHALERGHHADPHRLLGVHAIAGGGVAIRAFHPAAVSCQLVLPEGEAWPMDREGYGGMFVLALPRADAELRYRLRFGLAEGGICEREDPYRFAPTIGPLDLHLFNEGTHRRPWQAFGARCISVDGIEGVAFSTWAPNAEAVSVCGDFTAWDARQLPMRRLGSSGIWELFVPGLEEGARYKFDILGRDGNRRLKADPFAARAEHPPRSASRVFRSRHRWTDDDWMTRRARADPRREPCHAYEVHLGSWRRDAQGRVLSYRELAPLLADHVTQMGFTHVELMPIQEHPFDGSWGYQVTGYYAPTSRFGDPDDFRAFVDELHRRGIGVILDWVPAHFVKDDFALYRYDGTPLYEHANPQRGEHPEWGTAIFNYARHEVRSFLLGNALFWLEEMHVDGLRVDAVASMLYLDYSRKAGEWTPNEHGGNENGDAVEFLRSLNWLIGAEAPGCFTVAEESTAWPGVTAPVEHGGLGFTFKWNMGWMHDTLHYFAREAVHRSWHLDQLTFAMLYEGHERFVNPLSHDEVVHGKGSLWTRMPGDEWQKLANLRVLLAYMLTRPGKKLLFMGTELAPVHEWRHDISLPWDALLDPLRAGLQRCLADLGKLYGASPALWRSDPDEGSFRWIDCGEHDSVVLSYERRSGDEHLMVVLNLTPVPRSGYRVGAPEAGVYRIAVNTDASDYGGSGHGGQERVATEALPWNERQHSLVVDLPPLAALILVPTSRAPDDVAGHGPDAALRVLSDAAGIHADYADLGGRVRETSDDVRRELLRGLGLDPADIEGSLRRLADVPPDAPPASLSCPSLSEFAGDRPARGVTLNAWSIWRRDGWGVGDLTDVARVAEWAAEHGADWLGLSPLHLLRLDGSSIAPYSPSSRRWLHPLYMDVEAVPEWDETDARRRLRDALRLDERLPELRAADAVDHAGSLALKLLALADLHRAFRLGHEGRATVRGRAHAAFVDEQGEALQALATYLSLDEIQRASGVSGWRSWAAALRDPRSREVAVLREEHAERVAFHAWVQFEMDRQLQAAHRRARAAGMRIGLMPDLAVGTDPDGADTWREPGLYSLGAGLGAPPDPLGPFGQAWGLAVLNPLESRRNGHRAWRELMRGVMRNAGAVRIDHAFGLVRQFWIPDGRGASEGAYVSQPGEGLLQVLAEEARAAGVLVVGEDLGTPPPDFSSFMRRGGLVSTRLAMFEQDDAGAYKRAASQSPHGMLAFATHDLPPLQGWLTGRDLELREQLTLFPDDRARDEAWEKRRRDRAELLTVLRADGLLPPGQGEPPGEDVARAVHAFLAATRAPMTAFQLDDLVGETEPVNMPGVGSDRWASWTRRQRIPVDDLDRDAFAREAWP